MYFQVPSRSAATNISTRFINFKHCSTYLHILDFWEHSFSKFSISVFILPIIWHSSSYATSTYFDTLNIILGKVFWLHLFISPIPPKYALPTSGFQSLPWWFTFQARNAHNGLQIALILQYCFQSIMLFPLEYFPARCKATFAMWKMSIIGNKFGNSDGWDRIISVITWYTPSSEVTGKLYWPSCFLIPSKFLNSEYTVL